MITQIDIDDFPREPQYDDDNIPYHSALYTKREVQEIVNWALARCYVLNLDDWK